MLTINKQDVFKTIIIIWFVATTGYVIYDVYAGYKIRGMQAAYNTGYTDSVAQLIDQTEKSGCTPFEVTKDAKKIQLVNGQCLSASPAGGQQAQQQGAPQTQAPAVKK